jgi:hypothetical protein
VKRHVETVLVVVLHLVTLVAVWATVHAHTGWGWPVCVGIAVVALIAVWGLARAFGAVSEAWGTPDWLFWWMVLCPCAVIAVGAGIQARVACWGWPATLGGAAGAMVAAVLLVFALLGSLLGLEEGGYGSASGHAWVALTFSLQFCLALATWHWPYVLACTVAWWGWLIGHFAGR